MSTTKTMTAAAAARPTAAASASNPDMKEAEDDLNLVFDGFMQQVKHQMGGDAKSGSGGGAGSSFQVFSGKIPTYSTDLLAANDEESDEDATATAAVGASGKPGDDEDGEEGDAPPKNGKRRKVNAKSQSKEPDSNDGEDQASKATSIPLSKRNQAEHLLCRWAESVVGATSRSNPAFTTGRALVGGPRARLNEDGSNIDAVSNMYLSPSVQTAMVMAYGILKNSSEKAVKDLTLTQLIFNTTAPYYFRFISIVRVAVTNVEASGSGRRSRHLAESTSLQLAELGKTVAEMACAGHWIGPKGFVSSLPSPQPPATTVAAAVKK